MRTYGGEQRRGEVSNRESSISMEGKKKVRETRRRMKRKEAPKENVGGVGPSLAVQKRNNGETERPRLEIPSAGRRNSLGGTEKKGTTLPRTLMEET